MADRSARTRRSRGISADGNAAIRALGWKPRAGQAEATTELIKALYSNARVIAFTAPTGSGKSGMALAAVRWVNGKAVIATPTKQLQLQYSDTFGLPVLFGRSEYECPLSPTGTAALAPCIAGQQCLFRAAGKCPYLAARDKLRGKPIIVINHPLLVIARLMQDDVLTRPITVIDECHRFLDAVASMMTPSEQEAAALDECEWEPSKIKARLKDALAGRDVQAAATLVTALRIATCRRLAPKLFEGEFTNETLLRSGLFGRVILVSATLPDDFTPDVMVEGPPQVPPERRPLIVLPVVSANAENQLGIANILVEVIRQIITTMDSQSPVIIHTGTTLLAEMIANGLSSAGFADRIVPAWGPMRKSVASVRRKPNRQIVIGPALTDGVDLPAAQLQIIAKIPFQPKGGVEEAARRIVQAYGRLVRGPDTSGTTVVLDANFRLIEPYLPSYVRTAVRWETQKP